MLAATHAHSTPETLGITRLLDVPAAAHEAAAGTKRNRCRRARAVIGRFSRPADAGQRGYLRPLRPSIMPFMFFSISACPAGSPIMQFDKSSGK